MKKRNEGKKEKERERERKTISESRRWTKKRADKKGHGEISVNFESKHGERRNHYRLG